MESIGPKEGQTTLIGDLWTRVASQVPDRVALWADDRSVSYGELLEDSLTTAGALVGASTRSALIDCRDGATYAKALLGTLVAGAIAVPVPLHLGAADQDALIARLAPDAVIDDEFVSQSRSVRSRALDLTRQDDDAPAMVLCTSGSVGVSRTVVHSHRGLLAALRSYEKNRQAFVNEAARDDSTNHKLAEIGDGYVSVIPMPLQVIAGVSNLLRSLLTG